MRQIQTLYRSYADCILDMDIFGKLVAVPKLPISQLEELYKDEFMQKKPLPTLEQNRYELSRLVSQDYKILYNRALELQDNEELFDLAGDATYSQFDFSSLKEMIPEVVEVFHYENSVTDDLRREIIEKYDLETGEDFKPGIAKTESLVGSTQEDMSTRLTDEEIGVLGQGFSEDELQSLEDDSTVFEDVYAGDEDSIWVDEDEGEESEDEDSESENDESDAEESDEDSEEDGIWASDEDEESEDSEEEEDSFWASDEDEEEDSEEDEEEESFIIEDDEEESEDEDEEESYIIEDNEEESEEEEESFIIEDEEEDSQDEEEEESLIIGDEEEPEPIEFEQPPPEARAPVNIATDDIEDDLNVEKLLAQVTQARGQPKELEKPKEGVVDRSSEPTDIRQFLRKHPNSEESFVLQYFTKKQVSDALKMGKINRKGTKLRI